jgi:hypothetical protein
MHQLATRNAQLPFEAFVSQLVEAATVEFRRLTYLPTLDDRARGRLTVTTTSRKKLTETEIVQMVRMYEDGKYSQEQLSRRFHCSATTVSRFVRKHHSQEAE